MSAAAHHHRNDSEEAADDHLPAMRQPTAVKRVITYLPRPSKDWKRLTKEEQKEFTTRFTSAKLELEFWILRDPDPNMDGNTKVVTIHLLHKVNRQTLQCNPSHQTIADEVGLKLRTVERCIARAKKAGWLASARYDRNTSNWYLMLCNEKKARAIDERMLFLEQARAVERLEARQEIAKRVTGFDPSEVAARTVEDPSEVAAPEPSEVAGKHLEGTPEDYLYEARKPLRVSAGGNPYALVRDGDVDVPYDVPRDAADLEATLRSITSSLLTTPPGLMAYFRQKLLEGELTPAMVDEHRRTA